MRFIKNYQVDEQLPQYPILNLEKEYEIPEGFEVSRIMDTWLEANHFINELKDINKEPSFMCSCMGYLVEQEDYVKVVYKVTSF